MGRRRAAPILVALGAASSLLAACGGSTSATQGVAAAASNDPVVRLAQKDIHAQLTSNAGYEGPASGPKAKRNQLIVFVAADITNGGIAGVAQGAAQATQALRWRLRILDGQASVRGRSLAMKQALALKPDGIILGGFDATEQREAMKRARADGIPVVGWHAGPRPGPDRADGLFTNVSTDPQAVARLAAHYVIAQSSGTAGVVIFYDSEFQHRGRESAGHESRDPEVQGLLGPRDGERSDPRSADPDAGIGRSSGPEVRHQTDRHAGHQRQLLRGLGCSPVSAGNIRRRSTVRRRGGRWRCVGIRPDP